MQELRIHRKSLQRVGGASLEGKAMIRTRTTHEEYLRHAMRSPSRFYESPRQVASDSVLSREEKIAVLSQWSDELGQIAEAQTESMSGPGVAAQLREVTSILDHLRRKEARARG